MAGAVITWLGCDLVTGQIVEELPDLTVSGKLGRLLMAYSSAAFSLPIPTAPRNWEGATEEGRTMIVAVLGGVPVWAGIVLRRVGGDGPTAKLACVSIEGYLERRYVADHTWTGQDEASVIAAGLLGDANAVEGINLVVDAPATGTLRDRTYFDQDDKTVYSAMRELAGVLGGPEWTVVYGWTTADQVAVSKTVRVRPRVGYATATPNAVFSTVGGSETRYSYSEDYSSGSGANHIVATSSGEGASRPQSAPARNEAVFAAGWPRYEHRYSPSSSITSIPTLDAHAAAALALMGRGARVLTLTARLDAYPLLGTDWDVGDDIGYDLIGLRHPAGLKGVVRNVGWDLDPAEGTISPILLTTIGQEVA